MLRPDFIILLAYQLMVFVPLTDAGQDAWEWRWQDHAGVGNYGTAPRQLGETIARDLRKQGFRIVTIEGPRI
jgi:hypothetical protein